MRILNYLGFLLLLFVLNWALSSPMETGAERILMGLSATAALLVVFYNKK